MAKRKKYDKGTNNDQEHITQKNKDWATRTPLKSGGELMCFGRVSCFCSISDTRRATFQEYPIYSLAYRLLTNKVHFVINKGNNKITELRTILQRESQNS